MDYITNDTASEPKRPASGYRSNEPQKWRPFHELDLMSAGMTSPAGPDAPAYPSISVSLFSTAINAAAHKAEPIAFPALVQLIQEGQWWPKIQPVRALAEWKYEKIEKLDKVRNPVYDRDGDPVRIKSPRAHQYDKAKNNLAYWLPSGLWDTLHRHADGGKHAGASTPCDVNGLVQPSGLQFIDIDGLADADAAAAVRDAVSLVPCITAAWLSASAMGIHAFALVDPPAANAADSYLAWGAVCRELKNRGIEVPPDRSAKNLMRPAYVSVDSQAYYNPDARPLAWQGQPETALDGPPISHGEALNKSTSGGRTSPQPIQGDDRERVREAARYMKPDTIDYNRWLAQVSWLKAAGLSIDEVDAWNATEPSKYKANAIQKKWGKLFSVDQDEAVGKIISAAYRDGMPRTARASGNAAGRDGGSWGGARDGSGRPPSASENERLDVDLILQHFADRFLITEQALYISANDLWRRVDKEFSTDFRGILQASLNEVDPDYRSVRRVSAVASAVATWVGSQPKQIRRVAEADINRRDILPLIIHEPAPGENCYTATNLSARNTLQGKELRDALFTLPEKPARARRFPSLAIAKASVSPRIVEIWERHYGWLLVRRLAYSLTRLHKGIDLIVMPESNSGKGAYIDTSIEACGCMTDPGSDAIRNGRNFSKLEQCTLGYPLGFMDEIDKAGDIKASTINACTAAHFSLEKKGCDPVQRRRYGNLAFVGADWPHVDLTEQGLPQRFPWAYLMPDDRGELSETDYHLLTGQDGVAYLQELVIHMAQDTWQPLPSEQAASDHALRQFYAARMEVDNPLTGKIEPGQHADFVSNKQLNAMAGEDLTPARRSALVKALCPRAESAKFSRQGGRGFRFVAPLPNNIYPDNLDFVRSAEYPVPNVPNVPNVLAISG